MLKKGDRVDNFKLPDQDENTVELDSMRGGRVLLSFHPLAWTSVCARQMKDLEEHSGELAEHGATALGISVDPVPSKKAWADELGIEKTRLLSDFWPHGEVAKTLGIFRKEEGISERAALVLDENGEVIFSKVYPIGDVPDLGEVLEVLRRQG